MIIPGAGGGSLHNNDRELYPHLREGIVLFLI
jgi:hypothetical protein